MSENVSPVQELDASGMTKEQVLNQLAEYEEDAKIRIIGLSDSAGWLAGVNRSLELIVAQNLGQFACMACDNAAIDIVGSVGLNCAHSMRSGSLLIRGDAGDFLAAYGIGGYVAVHGKAGDFAGYGMSGADLLIRSRCGNFAGAMMRSGALVLGNGCGENLGIGMTGGTIYVRGEVGSMADGVRVSRLKETDTIRLSLMLVRAGIKTAYDQFKVFRAKSDKG